MLDVDDVVLQELVKLRGKITSTVQVLTHLKEKLQFVNGKNLFEKQKLHEIEELVARVGHFCSLSVCIIILSCVFTPLNYQ